MKKVVFAAAILFLAAPVRAVNIWCAVDANLVTVAYDATSDEPPIRAFALDIELDGDHTFAGVQCLSPDFGYQIYPGSISIDGSGNVSEWGSCKCSGSYPGTLDDSNSMTIEMASAYEVGVDPDPCDAGDLVSFIVEGTGSINVTITVNVIRGGVVNEDSATVTPVITSCWPPPPPDCLCSGDPGYIRWRDTYGRPDCWCYRRQCRGDIDGVNTGPFPVAIPDLTIFKGAFNQVVLDPGEECADLDHVMTGPFACGIPDLTIFKLYFNKVVVPQCDQAPIITGCYNFWTN